MKEHIKLRKAKLADLEKILSLFVEAVRHICKKDYGTEQIDIWADAANNKAAWIKRIEQHFFLVATIDTEIVGFASLENGNYLDVLYVHKDHLQKGIANSLYQAMETASKEQGCTCLITDVSITARPMLERKGFSLLKENKNLIGGVEIINFRMQKKYGER